MTNKRNPGNKPIDPRYLQYQAEQFVREQRSAKQKAADESAHADLAWRIGADKRRITAMSFFFGWGIMAAIIFGLTVLYLICHALGLI